MTGKRVFRRIYQLKDSPISNVPILRTQFRAIVELESLPSTSTNLSSPPGAQVAMSLPSPAAVFAQTRSIKVSSANLL
jgi:hypothetical protein